LLGAALLLLLASTKCTTCRDSETAAPLSCCYYTLCAKKHCSVTESPPHAILLRSAVQMHVAKNYLCDAGSLSNIRVPLILGVWGEKGMGKTFQTELAFKKLG
jgi:hypothetical protein